MTIPQSEVQDLFPRFAAPLVNGEAAKRFGEPAARQLAQTFWQTMIDGPRSEAHLWNSFGDSFTLDDVAELRRCFEEEMKPSISPRQLVAIGEWCLKGEEERFAVGDQVRVRHGTVDPDYPDLRLGGWTGTIIKIDEDGVCQIKINQATLDQIHPVFRKRCDRDGLQLEIIDMHQEDLEPDLGEDLPLEQVTSCSTKPLDPNDREDRIRTALGVTTDDAVPLVETATLLSYFEYLKANLAFPFPASYSHHDGTRRIFRNVSVVGMSDEFPIEDEYGLVCVVKDDHEQWEAPLIMMEVGRETHCHQTLADYRRWFAEWGGPAPFEHACAPHERQDEHEGPKTPANTRVGRNAPCPCGSGKKFKKCCLRKQSGDSIFVD